MKKTIVKHLGASWNVITPFLLLSSVIFIDESSIRIPAGLAVGLAVASIQYFFIKKVYKETMARTE
jgi:hypothetical protein